MQVTEVQAETTAAFRAMQAPLEREDDARRNATRLLDQVIPLQRASHADVSRYVVEIPMRYAECFAMLKDGRKVAFKDRSRFVGWSRDPDKPAYLFRKNLLRIELRTDRTADKPVTDVILESAVRSVQTLIGRSSDQERRFIGTDGSLVCLPGRRLASIL